MDLEFLIVILFFYSSEELPHFVGTLEPFEVHVEPCVHVEFGYSFTCRLGLHPTKKKKRERIYNWKQVPREKIIKERKKIANLPTQKLMAKTSHCICNSTADFMA